MAPAIAAFREDVRTAQSSDAEERAVCVAA